MYTDEETDLITLDSFACLTYKVKFGLLDGLRTSVPAFEKYRGELIKTLGDGVYNKLIKDFYDRSYRESVLRELSKKGINAVTAYSPLYPDCLRQIPLPPVVLYYKGNINLLKEEKFAVVGSRKALPAAKKQCENFVRDLSEDFVIVTGLAVGTDTAVIRGALESGKIICVLAHGFDHIYPAINTDLLKKVIENGLVLTEFLPSVQARNYTFPIRNRIIAGLSRGVLVAAAGRRSGALITADYALEYGRDVFAFPYSLGVSSGEGCNALIKKGAYLCDCVNDVRLAFGINTKSDKKLKLSDEECKIVRALKDNGAMHLEELAKILKVQPFQISVIVSMLEMKGLVVKIGGNRISAV